MIAVRATQFYRRENNVQTKLRIGSEKNDHINADGALKIWHTPRIDSGFG